MISIVPCAMMYQKLQAVPWELSQPCHATLSSALSSLHSDLRGSTVHRRRAASLPGFLEDIGICAVLRCRDELCLAAAGAGLGEGQDVVAPMEARLWGLQSRRNPEVHGLRQRRFEAFESVDFLQTYAVLQQQKRLFETCVLAIQSWINGTILSLHVERMHRWERIQDAPTHLCCNFCGSAGRPTYILARKGTFGGHCYRCHLLWLTGLNLFCYVWLMFNHASLSGWWFRWWWLLDIIGSILMFIDHGWSWFIDGRLTSYLIY